MLTRKRPVVYVAGPYSSDPVGNTRAACELFHQLFDLGFAPIIPHLSMLLDFHKPRPWEDWMELDLPIVARSQAVYRMPGPSRGADCETAHAAALGIPVFLSIERLTEWAKGLPE